ncbi:MAG: hypothetical protein MI685_04685, partial [Chlorobiales bacterium]|nr:hypothetical protein [Chlorobiales bacterium]
LLFDRITQSLRSTLITRASSLLRIAPPLDGASVLSASLFTLVPFPLPSPSKVPAVQRKSLNQDHAISTPDTIWPVNRLPPDSSWSYVHLQF